MVKISTGLFGFAEAHPVIYLSIDLVLFLLAACFFLFLKDIQDFLEVCCGIEFVVAASPRVKTAAAHTRVM